ncbi:MAG: hydrolase 1, exosortase A system-associated [Polaromonas sp.]
MTYTEEAALFACEGDTLLGILASPEMPAQTGVVVIVGGPQYRAGSHRQFVLLSRALAAAGYAVLRFDSRGMGDSEGQARDFEDVSADIAAAIDALQQRLPAVRQVALWGLCDGASAALLYCHETHDPRVSGLCLLNPWVRSEASLARTQIKHYYTQRLRQKEFWLKLLSGKVALGALGGFLQKIRLATSGPNQPATEKQAFQQRMAAAWHSLSRHILLLLSEDDYTAKEFLEYAGKDPAWENALTNPNLIRHTLPGADHTFSAAKSRVMVENLTLSWLVSQTSGSQDDTK